MTTALRWRAAAQDEDLRGLCKERPRTLVPLLGRHRKTFVAPVIPPTAGAQVLQPLRKMDLALCLVSGEVDDAERHATRRIAPVPRDETIRAPVVVPCTGDLEQAPFAVVEDRVFEQSEKFRIELIRSGIRRFVRSAHEVRRDAHAAPFGLSLVEEAKPGGQEGQCRSRDMSVVREGVGGARLVVVLEKPREARLIGDVCPQVAADAGMVTIAQTVI